MLAKLVADANSIQRVFTRRDPDRCNLFDLRSVVDVVKRSTKTQKDGTVVSHLMFANGKAVKITYEEV